MADEPNLVGQAYDEPGSWGRLSEGWPETAYSIGKLLLCTRAEVVPYGQYVVVGAKQRPFRRYDASAPGGYDYSDAVIRVASDELKAKLEAAYEGMFGECGYSLQSDPKLRDAERAPGDEPTTSAEVASLAGEYIDLSGDELWERLHYAGKARDVEQVKACDVLAAHIRSIAASALGQRRTMPQPCGAHEYIQSNCPDCGRHRSD